ncbi:hypothetical protein [Psychroserpens sp. SPM9]|uniref:hypothetical protein n=1 Tax=Psychroserpens sp. SPM9 TaxID=2975598 RepID=UPI0021A5069F|nr:hypothetical protein [Psychroserpens sp. SPM9]MDG5492760.1 hypothetical protein [Psychroserpens sp. SPM9]
MLFAEIQQKIQNAKQLDFGQIFNDSIELFKKMWLQGLLMLLIMFGFMIPFIFIIYIPLIIFGVADASNPGAYDGLAPIAMIFIFVAYLLFIFAMMVVSFGLKAGLYRIMRQKDLGIIANDDYFYFLRKPYLSKTIKLSLAFFGISMLATLLCVFPIIYVMVPLNLLVVMYAFNPEISGSNLIKASFDLGNKKWFITFGLTLVAGFLAQLVGMLLCGIGIFFTASFAAVPLYFVYKEVVGFEEGEVKQIGNNPDFDATI